MLLVLTFSDYFTYQLTHKNYLMKLFKFGLVLCYQLIYEHSGVNGVTLLMKNYGASNFVQFFLDQSVQCIKKV